jgi:hypothetical protein
MLLLLMLYQWFYLKNLLLQVLLDENFLTAMIYLSLFDISLYLALLFQTIVLSLLTLFITAIDVLLLNCFHLSQMACFVCQILGEEWSCQLWKLPVVLPVVLSTRQCRWMKMMKSPSIVRAFLSVKSKLVRFLV